MRMIFLLVLLLFSMYEAFPGTATKHTGKSSVINSLKNLAKRLRLAGENSIFHRKSKTTSDNRHDESRPQDTKPSQVAPSTTFTSGPPEPSSYAPSIRNQHISSGTGGPAPTIPSKEPYKYAPTIRSGGATLSGGSGGKGSYAPPVPSQATKQADPDSRVMADATAFAVAAHETQTNPISSGFNFMVPDPGSPEISLSDAGTGISIPVDSLLPSGGDGGGGGGAGDGSCCGLGDAVVSCACAIGGCLLDAAKACVDPSNWCSCCCCQP